MDGSRSCKGSLQRPRAAPSQTTATLAQADQRNSAELAGRHNISEREQREETAEALEVRQEQTARAFLLRSEGKAELGERAGQTLAATQATSAASWQRPPLLARQWACLD